MVEVEVEVGAAVVVAGTGVEEVAVVVVMVGDAIGEGGRRAHEMAVVVEVEEGAELWSTCRRVGWSECRAAGRAPEVGGEAREVERVVVEGEGEGEVGVEEGAGGAAEAGAGGVVGEEDKRLECQTCARGVGAPVISCTRQGIGGTSLHWAPSFLTCVIPALLPPILSSTIYPPAASEHSPSQHAATSQFATRGARSGSGAAAGACGRRGQQQTRRAAGAICRSRKVSTHWGERGAC